MAAVYIRIDENLQRGLEQKFRAKGLSFEDGLWDYLGKDSINCDCPLCHDENGNHRQPNAETIAAMESLENGNGVSVTLDEFREMLRNA